MAATQAPPTDVLRVRFVAETEQTINQLRERKLELLNEAEECERQENDARKLLRTLREGT